MSEAVFSVYSSSSSHMLSLDAGAHSRTVGTEPSAVTELLLLLHRLPTQKQKEKKKQKLQLWQNTKHQ